MGNLAEIRAFAMGFDKIVFPAGCDHNKIEIGQVRPAFPFSRAFLF